MFVWLKQNALTPSRIMEFNYLSFRKSAFDCYQNQAIFKLNLLFRECHDQLLN